MGKDQFIGDWMYSSTGSWFRQIYKPQPYKYAVPSPNDYDSKVYVKIHLHHVPSLVDPHAGEYIWIPEFRSVTGLASLNHHMKQFSINEEENAKAYVDNLIMRAIKLTAFE